MPGIGTKDWIVALPIGSRRTASRTAELRNGATAPCHSPRLLATLFAPWTLA